MISRTVSNAIKAVGFVVASAAATVAILAPPAGAHEVDSQRTSVWAVVIAAMGVLTAISGILLSFKGHRRPGLGIFVAGIVLLSVATTGFSFDSGPVSSPAEVEIVEPEWGATLTSPITVRIVLRNATIVPLDRTSGPPTEGHLHLYVNGRAIGMFADTAEVIELAPGRYVLQVEFTGADHHSFSPPVADVVEMEVVSEK